MLGEPNFLIFIVVSLVVAGLMQFYFLGTAQFMQDIGIASKHVPASMAIAQAAQRFFESDDRHGFGDNIDHERESYSWERMVETITSLTRDLAGAKKR